MSEHSAENDARDSRTRICYCPQRGDNYHLSGDPGCISDTRVIPPEVGDE